MIKGNLIVGQSGGCTPVINRSLVGIIEAGIRSSKIGKVFGMRYGILGVLEDNIVDLTHIGKERLALLRNTPASALGSCRYKLKDEDKKRVIAILKKYNLRHFLLIGGNDTAQTTLKVAEFAEEEGYELNVIAIPKTIDNDLPYTDHTPGYGSVSRFIAVTTQEAGRDSVAMKRVDPVKIIEVMGRNAGWLVASAALGKRRDCEPPHLLYFPEYPFSVEEFLTDIEKAYRKYGYAVAVISETVRDGNGRRIGERKSGVVKDSFGHKYVDSVAGILANIVEREMKIRARYDKPGTIQRMSMAYISKVDQKEAYMAGKKGVEFSLKGKTKIMVTIKRLSDNPYRVAYGSIGVEKIAGVEKLLPKSFVSRNKKYITEKFIKYALPLIGDIPDFFDL